MEAQAVRINGVAFPSLTQEIWAQWRHSLTHGLVISDLDRLIDRDEEEELEDADVRRDRKTLAIINLTVSPSLTQLAQHAATSREPYWILQDRFAAGSDQRVMALENKLRNLRKQPGESIAAYCV